jgi:hypothetical protein
MQRIMELNKTLTSNNMEMFSSLSLNNDCDRGFYFYYYDFLNDDELRLDYDMEIRNDISQRVVQVSTQISQLLFTFQLFTSKTKISGY